MSKDKDNGPKLYTAKDLGDSYREGYKSGYGWGVRDARELGYKQDERMDVQ